MKHVTHLTLLFIFSVQSLQAQLWKKYAGYEQKYYKSMRYGLYKPANYDVKKYYPLIVYLHGSRDTVSRDMVYYQESIQKENPSFVLTPKCDEPDQGWGNTWRDSHTTAMIKTLALVDSLTKIYPIDKNRLYLYGISMGGFGVFSTLAKEPGKFAAAYAICGGSDIKAAPKLLETPLWIFHGEMDDIVPVYLSRDVYKELIRLGGKKVKYTEYPGVKHNSWENVSREKLLAGWLFAKRKDPTK
ncbi:MAG TPA: prolyl oligopeptidase family serine peptidase [Chryseolinea sp.]|nr:prolyl oligopeptidase family serine peptidase [Chryseolinea sp.]